MTPDDAIDCKEMWEDYKAFNCKYGEKLDYVFSLQVQASWTAAQMIINLGPEKALDIWKGVFERCLKKASELREALDATESDT